jgi:hypothetical protein
MGDGEREEIPEEREEIPEKVRKPLHYIEDTDTAWSEIGVLST